MTKKELTELITTKVVNSLFEEDANFPEPVKRMWEFLKKKAHVSKPPYKGVIRNHSWFIDFYVHKVGLTLPMMMELSKIHGDISIYVEQNSGDFQMLISNVK